MPRQEEGGILASKAEQLDGRSAPTAPRDGQSIAEVLPAFYAQVRALAERQLRAERTDHTLQPTALVHEAFLRISQQPNLTWQNRAHFFGVAARTIRSILVNHAVSLRAEKRGGGRGKVQLETDMIFSEDDTTDLLELDEALEDLAAIDEKKARVVELRYFGGLTVEETAQALKVSGKTVQRDWRWARAWLYSRLDQGEERPT